MAIVLAARSPMMSVRLDTLDTLAALTREGGTVTADPAGQELTIGERVDELFPGPGRDVDEVVEELLR